MKLFLDGDILSLSYSAGVI